MRLSSWTSPRRDRREQEAQCRMLDIEDIFFDVDSHLLTLDISTVPLISGDGGREGKCDCRYALQQALKKKRLG